MAIQKKRFEYKYRVHLSNHMQLRAYLNQVMPRDKNLRGRDRYAIRSVYFDDPKDTAMYEKLDGKFKRRKFRLRFYDRSDQLIKLEKKEKLGGISYKTEITIPLDIFNIALTSPMHLPDKVLEDPLYEEFRQACRQERLTAKALIEYEREAWVLPFEGIRICFDLNVRAESTFTDPFAPRPLRFQVLRHSERILEVKYERFFPNHIRRLLESCDLTNSAYSKYSASRMVLREAYQYSK